MPILIDHLGNRTYGIWVLIGTLLGYFGMLDIGLSRAVMRFVSQALGKNDRAEADEWINAGFFTFLALSLVGIAASFVIWFVVGQIISDPAEAEMLRNACFIAAFAFSLSLPSLCFQGVISAHIRQDVIQYIQIGTTVFRSTGILLVIYFGGGLLFLVMVAACATLLNSLIVFLMAYRVHGQMHINIHLIGKLNYKTFIQYAMSTFISQIADILRFKTNPLIIAPVLGLAAITPFSIAEQVNNLVGGICAGVLNNLTPGFSGLEGEGGVEGNTALRRGYFFSYKISCYIGVFVVGMALMLSHAFILRWMGPEHGKVYLIANIMLIGSVFAIIQMPTICLLFSISKQTFYAYSNWLQAGATIVLVIILIHSLGLLGVAIAIAVISFLVKLFVQPFGAASVFGMSILRYHWQHTLPNISIPAIFLIVFYYLAKDYIVPDYVNIVITAGIGGILFFPVVFFLGFNKSERAFLRKCILPAGSKTE